MSEHGHVDPSNKKIALLISVLALCLALAETAAKSAQTDSLGRNVEASNLWAFFQAKTVRQTTARIAAEGAETEGGRLADPAQADALAKRAEGWRKDVARWEDEPSTGEGRKQLAARAKMAEEQRDTALARYHHYEVSSAAFQIAIVLASANVITGAVILVWLAGALGLAGVALGAVGLLAPHALHLL